MSAKGLSIPRVDGKALCSRIDPIAEALAWIKNNESIFNWADRICVVGLGGGYHINQLAQAYPKKMILVLEPEVHLIRAFEENFEVLTNLQFYTDIQKLNTAQHRQVVVPFRAAFNGQTQRYNSLLLRALGDNSEKVNLKVFGERQEVRCLEVKDKIHLLMKELLK